MSQDSPLPLARLIADAVARAGSLRRAAAAVTDAAWKRERVRYSISPSTVSDWLDGAIPHRRTRLWISDGLRIPLEDLTRAAEAQRAARRAASQTAGQPVDSDDVERRAFGKLLFAAGAAVAGLDVERFAGVVAGTRPDSAALDDMETLTTNLVRQEASLAPHSLFPAVRGHLAGVYDMLAWTPSNLAPRAFSLTGQTALLAGYLKFKQDDRAAADLYWSLADQLGERAGDPRLRAALLVLRSQRHTRPDAWAHEHDVPRALFLLDQAVSVLGSDPDPVAAAHVFTFRACSHAEAGLDDPGHAHAALSDLEDVRSQLARIATTDGSFYIVESVRGEAIQKGSRALVHLGRPLDAARDLDGLLASISPASLSWRSGVMHDLAAARASAGEPEHACELLIGAVDLAMRASATRAVNRVRRARHEWLAGYDGPAVGLLDERLSVLSGPPAA
jgi:hypothetical protein